MYARWLKAVPLALAIFLLPPGSPAMAFNLKDTNGTPQRLADAKGQWVVVNFWATWCAPCVKEIPDIAEFAKANPTVKVIGIALDWDETDKRAADEAKLKRVAQKIGHTYPLVLGGDYVEKTFGKIKGMPTTIVYGPDGKEVYNKTGVVTKELLKGVISGEIVSKPTK